MPADFLRTRFLDSTAVLGTPPKSYSLWSRGVLPSAIGAGTCRGYDPVSIGIKSLAPLRRATSSPPVPAFKHLRALNPQPIMAHRPDGDRNILEQGERLQQHFGLIAGQTEAGRVGE